MRYAQIKNSTIQNIIILEETSNKVLFGTEAGFDALVRIDLLEVQPSIGWSYNSDNQQFSVVIDS